MKIDFSRIVTARDKADQVANARLAAAKAECARRITTVLSPPTQINLTAAAAAGRLAADQRTAWQAGLDWIDKMRATAAKLAANPDADLTANNNWPEPPPGVSDLARQF